MTTVTIVGYKHERASILDEAVAYVIEHGLDRLSFGKLADRLGIADRTIVYYFPWKAKLNEAVAERVVRAVLDGVATAAKGGPVDVEALPSVARRLGQDLGGLVGAYGEVVGRAAAGHDPYAAVAVAVRRSWLGAMTDWNARDLAMLDGLLLGMLIDSGD